MERKEHMGAVLKSDTAAKGTGGDDFEFRITDRPVDYEEALAFMERRVEEIHGGTQPEIVWMLEHPPLYTAGTSASDDELLDPDRFPVYRTGRGGRYTYHGPGQRVVYVMADLRKRNNDVRAFVHNLEEWVIRTLAWFNVIGERRDDRVGIWVRQRAPDNPLSREHKIAAIGVRVRRWVTYHGIAINLDPDLDHYSGIMPCGIADHGVTSLLDMGVTATMPELDAQLMATFEGVFEAPLR